MTGDYRGCPFCGCDDLDVHNLAMCEDELRVYGLLDEADEVVCIEMVECLGCFAQAPASRWNRRPDPWRYPPDLPEPGQKILFTYMHPKLGESSAITAVYCNVQDWHSIVRWMPAPEFEPRSITEQKGTIADEKQVD